MCAGCSVAQCCSVLQRGAVWCGVAQCGAVCCSVLESVEVCCSVLQCVAVAMCCRGKNVQRDFSLCAVQVSCVCHTYKCVMSHT